DDRRRRELGRSGGEDSSGAAFPEHPGACEVFPGVSGHHGGNDDRGGDFGLAHASHGSGVSIRLRASRGSTRSSAGERVAPAESFVSPGESSGGERAVYS